MRLPLLVLHISAGIIGILAGTAAISFRKGSSRHALAGQAFVIAMLTMAASAVYLAVLKHQMGNVLGGFFAFYLVATGWLSAKQGDGGTGSFRWVALLVPMAVSVANFTYGLEKSYGQTGSTDGVPAGMNFFMGARWLCWLPRETLACWFAAASSAYSACRSISGACASGCSLPPGRFS
jgi:hypothetical protein